MSSLAGYILSCDSRLPPVAVVSAKSIDDMPELADTRQEANKSICLCCCTISIIVASASCKNPLIRRDGLHMYTTIVDSIYSSPSFLFHHRSQQSNKSFSYLPDEMRMKSFTMRTRSIFKQKLLLI